MASSDFYNFPQSLSLSLSLDGLFNDRVVAEQGSNGLDQWHRTFIGRSFQVLLQGDPWKVGAASDPPVLGSGPDDED